MRKGEKKPLAEKVPRRPTNTHSFRLPEETDRQIRELSDRTGLSLTAVLVIALDRIYWEKRRNWDEPAETGKMGKEEEKGRITIKTDERG